ncbi:MAG: NAD(P)/FAD-dependent oxidoreductase [Nitrospirae bacterium]|nr:NAD(P)/FAD-dependent oxidoreductase [Nitrospirota bacterium]
MKYDAIMIGAGLGGLTAAAFLAQAGRRVLVLEKTSELGGRCRSAQLMGVRFDPGVERFSGYTLGSLALLGKAKDVEPVRHRVSMHMDGKAVTLPFGMHTPGELSRLGLSFGQSAGFGLRFARRTYMKGFKEITNTPDLAERLTDDKRLRDILAVSAFFAGNNPDNMPAGCLDALFGRSFGYGKAFFPKAGAGRIPELLADVVRGSGGGIVYQSDVSKVLVDGGSVKGVVVDGRELLADVVVSNAEIRATVLDLVGKDRFDAGYLDTLSYYREGLSMAVVLVVFKGAGLKKGVAGYAALPESLGAAFRALWDGKFPDSPMCYLSCPDAADGAPHERFAGTVRFLLPKGGAEKSAVIAQADKALRAIDQIVPGFHNGIIESRVLSPQDYVLEFGVPPVASLVADSVHYQKMPVDTPVRGLYCVGETVQPGCGGAALAVESGRVCAERILKGR